MPDQKDKPGVFKAGATTISARELNMLRAAVPRLLKGGAGISIEPYGDRFIMRLADTQGTPPGSIAIVTITELHNDFLVCDRDGATITVAKPWALRAANGAPVNIGYVVDDELLVARLPSARVEDANGDPVYDANGNIIVWEDLNTAGFGANVELTFATEFADYIDCTDVNSNTVHVAKPYLLRNNLSANPRNGETYTYSNFHTRTVAGANTGTEVVKASYQAGDKIVVGASPSVITVTIAGVSTPIDYVDLNADGRAWAQTA